MLTAKRQEKLDTINPPMHTMCSIVQTTTATNNRQNGIQYTGIRRFKTTTVSGYYCEAVE